MHLCKTLAYIINKARVFARALFIISFCSVVPAVGASCLPFFAGMMTFLLLSGSFCAPLFSLISYRHQEIDG